MTHQMGQARMSVVGAAGPDSLWASNSQMDLFSSGGWGGHRRTYCEKLNPGEGEFLVAGYNRRTQ
jgi:hypothetical protein